MASAATGDAEPALGGRRIVLGVSGGIAAYKAAELTRLFVKAGASVRVVMTEAATRFITPLTLQTLSGAPVGLDLFDAGSEAEIGHIRLADEADVLVVAPATADVIARLAAGMANDLLTAVALATRAPVLLAPAMNVNMWENSLVKANLARLLGPEGGGRFRTVGPDRGELACGWVGAGRLMEPADIVAAAAALLAPPSALPGPGGLDGLRVVVTAGPTREPIDEVRFLANRSSGKMGLALAESAATGGADVTLLAGPGTPALAGAGPPVERIDFETAAELERALGKAAADADVVVMAAAVADFRARVPAAGKLSRRAGGDAQKDGHGDGLTLDLVPVPDLIAGLARARRGGRPYLVGFAAELGGGATLSARAAAKLAEKSVDAIVANDVSAPGIGFGADENAVTLLFADGARLDIERAAKRAVADQLWQALAPRLPKRTGRG